ncbi:MAG TPA: DNA polymerase III subunit alpha, partial [Rhabdochlamydiaceae bacterium]|nr:DNA polymerase III subunit alpha [Rhabdochlamydiaceae bacterium]
GEVYGAVEFYKACREAKIKPIIGCEFHLAPYSRFDKKRIPGTPAGFPLELLAKNKQGYKNLCKLSSAAHIEGFYYTPRIDKALLAQHAEGLICLSGSLQGLIPYLIMQGKEKELLQEVEWFQQLFKDDFYFELQRSPMSEDDIGYDGMDKEGWLLQNYRDYVRNQEIVIQKLVELGKQYGIRCVATNPVHYLERSDWKAHEILMNVQSGEPCEIWERDSQGNPKNRVLNPKRQVYFTHELYLKTSEQMAELFADLPDAVAATKDIAEKINLELDFKARFYPVFTPPEGFTKEDYLRALCKEGIPHRYTPERLAKVQEKYPGKDPMQVIKDRLSYELDIIISKGMGDYILIVHDFISWAKNRGIPVGPGRGSGAGSIILFLIGITDIEPLRFNLFFERFINPERLSYPDIDVDICMDRRDEVIEYTVQKYGKDKVAQIITFGTMKAKMAIKDVGRVLSMPLPKVNAIAKLVPEDLGITLDKALENPDLKKAYDTDREVQELIDIARRLEGSVRNTGIHAAGLIISGDPLTEHIPVCSAKDSTILVTQFSMKPVEAVGMLKIDFLGLKTLTSIQKTVDAIRASHGKEIDWVNLPLEDKTTFNLMNQGKLNGIFQMESTGMQELSRQLHIDTFEEIIAVNALYRPGPMEMIPSFISRKHGKEPIEVDHPLMKEVLSETYGIMVYQEQVMQIASLLANYTLGEGDVLRRAMGKKDREEMANQREKFRTGALQKGLDTDTAMKIFDKIEKFASYGFNKSHAAAYGYLAYVTAYLKSNYPGAWMAALMTCDRDDVAKVAKLIGESQTMNIPILPPDVNESGQEFVATPKGIRFAMGGIKGVGEGVVEAIIQERASKGPFRSLFDFCSRIDTKKIGKKTIENLIEAGCFDFTGCNRQTMIIALEEMYQTAMQKQKEISKGFIDLFGESADPVPVAVQQTETLLSKQHMLRREKELLGFYVTGHPLDEFRALIQRLSCVPFAEVNKLEHDAVLRTAFIVDEVQVKTSGKTQKKFAILKISDGTDRLEVPVWSELYEEKGHLLIDNQLLYAILQIDRREGDPKLQCRWFDDLTKANEEMMRQCETTFDQLKVQQKNMARRDKKGPPKQEKKEMKGKVFLKLNADQVRHSHVLHLKKLFRSYPGSMPLVLEFLSSNKTLGHIVVDARWGVSLEKDLEQELRKLPFLIHLNVVA